MGVDPFFCGMCWALLTSILMIYVYKLQENLETHFWYPPLLSGFHRKAHSRILQAGSPPLWSSWLLHLKSFMATRCFVACWDEMKIKLLCNKEVKIQPIGSTYGIFASIWLIFMVNVGKYTIHGSYGQQTKSAKPKWTIRANYWDAISFWGKGPQCLDLGSFFWFLLTGSMCLEMFIA